MTKATMTYPHVYYEEIKKTRGFIKTTDQMSRIDAVKILLCSLVMQSQLYNKVSELAKLYCEDRMVDAANGNYRAIEMYQAKIIKLFERGAN
jgi:hypothetical protein